MKLLHDREMIPGAEYLLLSGGDCDFLRFFKISPALLLPQMIEPYVPCNAAEPGGYTALLFKSMDAFYRLIKGFLGQFLRQIRILRLRQEKGIYCSRV